MTFCLRSFYFLELSNENTKKNHLFASHKNLLGLLIHYNIAKMMINKRYSRCLKITEKVSFNIASEASYVYKSSLKMPKIVHFGEFLKTWSLRSNSVTRQVSFNRTKIGGKCQNAKNSNATFWVIFKQCEHVILQNKEFFMRHFLIKLPPPLEFFFFCQCPL